MLYFETGPADCRAIPVGETTTKATKWHCWIVISAILRIWIWKGWQRLTKITIVECAVVFTAAHVRQLGVRLDSYLVRSRQTAWCEAWQLLSTFTFIMYMQTGWTWIAALLWQQHQIQNVDLAVLLHILLSRQF